MRMRAFMVIVGVVAMFVSETVSATEASLNGADTAWILASTALVLLMTLPGLALFYGGLVRSKNVLSVLLQCFATAGVTTVLWFTVGYSLAFGEGGPYIGDRYLGRCGVF